MLPNRCLVLGGAASGKSSFAEALAVSSGMARTYIATAQAFDEEMADKIARHRKTRGPGWVTVEAPHDPGPALDALAPDAVALLDCATLWLSNRILAEADPAADRDRLLARIAGCPGRVIVVSNEVGAGIVPDNALARRFREAQGRLNIALAEQADLVVQVVAGLPNVLKGRLP